MGKLEDVRNRLNDLGYAIGEDEKPNGQTQLWVKEVDAVINVWSTGTCNVQGKESAKMSELLGDLVGKGRKRRSVSGSGPVPTAGTGSKKVFVVYGHDRAARDQLAEMLRRWGLEPLILDELPSGGNTIIEKLEHYQDGVDWAVVLLTPDDIGHPVLDPSAASPRARQNVVLEMGMLIGKLGRSKVTVLYKNADTKLELPSDINGYVYIPFEDHINDAGKSLAKEMSQAGFFKVPVEKL